MEAFEGFVALAMEAEGLVVSEAVKFSVRRRTRRSDREEFQTHGYEVDLVGARSDGLVLASVKSFFGSKGVKADHVSGDTSDLASGKRYALLNDVELRGEVVSAAAKRYGYRESQVELRLYAGKFAGEANEAAIRAWARKQRVGSKPVGVHGLDDVVDIVIREAASKAYRDNAVLVTLKVLDAAGRLRDPSDDAV